MYFSQFQCYIPDWPYRLAYLFGSDTQIVGSPAGNAVYRLPYVPVVEKQLWSIIFEGYVCYQILQNFQAQAYMKRPTLWQSVGPWINMQGQRLSAFAREQDCKFETDWWNVAQPDLVNTQNSHPAAVNIQEQGFPGQRANQRFCVMWKLFNATKIFAECRNVMSCMQKVI